MVQVSSKLSTCSCSWLGQACETATHMVPATNCAEFHLIYLLTQSSLCFPVVRVGKRRCAASLCAARVEDAEGGAETAELSAET